MGDHPDRTGRRYDAKLGIQDPPNVPSQREIARSSDLWELSVSLIRVFIITLGQR